MKISRLYYIVDTVSETIKNSFVVSNHDVAFRNFQWFLKNLPSEVNVSDFVLYRSDEDFTLYETTDELNENALDVAIEGSMFEGINKPEQPKLDFSESTDK